jgi:hypothetical protein
MEEDKHGPFEVTAAGWKSKMESGELKAMAREWKSTMKVGPERDGAGPS